jgi:hypothetical protein
VNAVDAALGLARRGMRIHPCAPGQKVPLLEDWPAKATLDPTTIKAWWRRWPNANLAVAAGGSMRLLVVDIDPDANGETSMAALEREYWGIPATVEVVTPRGGRHLYLIVPNGRPMPGNSAGKLGPGIDTRGEGGYVLAPPSVVNGRAYTWSVDSGDRIAIAPAWLLDSLEQSGGNGKATPPDEWLELVTAGVDEGARNQSIARVAGLLFRRLVRRAPEEATLVEELVACWNAVNCRPPLQAVELKRTLDSIAAREKQRRRLA